jgi:hypothetical protein
MRRHQCREKHDKLQEKVRQALRPDVTKLIRNRREEDEKRNEGRTTRGTLGRSIGLKGFIYRIGMSVSKWLHVK